MATVITNYMTIDASDRVTGWFTTLAAAQTAADLSLSTQAIGNKIRVAVLLGTKQTAAPLATWTPAP